MRLKLIACALLLASAAHAQKFESTTYLECMEKAGKDAKQAWKDECHRLPDVKTRDEDHCALPILIARELNARQKARWNVCAQAKSAGALK